jgi:predicted DCC family thiol-disulfide oxidoreductase YuxK
VTAAERPALLYDADCGFCRWSVARVLAWDRAERLRPVAIQDPEGQRLLAEMAADERLTSAHLVTVDGRVLSGGAAAPEVLRLLPGGRPLAAVAAAVPGLTERAYRAVANNRTVFGRLISEGAKARARRRIAQRAGDA